jgi:hypothetical protein
MARGIEGERLFHRGAETDMIRAQKEKVTAESLISGQRIVAKEMLGHNNIVAALKGEEVVPFIANNPNREKQLGMAKELLHATPFLKKYMPHTYDEDEQAALIVSISESLQEQRQKMH